MIRESAKKLIEKYGDVDHQAKKANMDDMCYTIDKNKVDAIMSQMSVMRQLEDVYVNKLGRDEYECQLVQLANQMPGMLVVRSYQGGCLFTP